MIPHPATHEGAFYLRLGSIWFDSRREHRATYVVVFTSHLKYAEATSIEYVSVVLPENDSTDMPTQARNYALSVSVQLLRTVTRALCLYRI